MTTTTLSWQTANNLRSEFKPIFPSHKEKVQKLMTRGFIYPGPGPSPLGLATRRFAVGVLYGLAFFSFLYPVFLSPHKADLTFPETLVWFVFALVSIAAAWLTQQKTWAGAVLSIAVATGFFSYVASWLARQPEDKPIGWSFLLLVLLTVPVLFAGAYLLRDKIEAGADPQEEGAGTDNIVNEGNLNMGD